MIYIPFIFGGIGFIFWGWIGALLGCVTGGVVSGIWYLAKNERVDGRSSHKEPEASSQSTTENRAFADQQLKYRILALVANVMKADGIILKAEVDSVKPFLLKHYGVEGGREALQMLKHLINTPIESRLVAAKLQETLNYSSRLEVVHLLLTIAFSDGKFDIKERGLIRDIALHLGISMADCDALFALFLPKTNNKWAYAALGIAPTATDDEVKRAYHRMAMIYHPDKVVENEELKTSATEKFREIQQAYECIKKERNII